MAKVTKNSIINNVIERDINCAPVFFEMGMFCIGCPSAAGESIEQACMVHGIDADELVDRLNEYFGE
ncbi:MAG: DUF1858 domain-containing protein [Christensenellaceae bacterium]|nr:DUF1858 domain-containing protein [Christensenellaceae bacterium]